MSLENMKYPIKTARGRAWLTSLMIGGLGLSPIATGENLNSELNLGLRVEGFVVPRPTWRNESDIEIQTLTFSFSAPQNSTPISRLSSGIRRTKLVNAKSYPARIQYTSPKQCSIGRQPLSQARLDLMLNRTTFTDNSIFNIDEGLQQYQLEFVFASPTLLSAGSIECIVPGRFTLQY